MMARILESYWLWEGAGAFNVTAPNPSSSFIQPPEPQPEAVGAFLWSGGNWLWDLAYL
jgi:hypothetical protein